MDIDRAFEDTIMKAIKVDEIVESSRKAGLRDDTLKNHLERNEKLIFNSAKRELQELNRINAENSTAHELLRDDIPNYICIENANERKAKRRKFFGIFNISESDLPLWPDETTSNISLFFIFFVILPALVYAIGYSTDHFTPPTTLINLIRPLPAELIVLLATATVGVVTFLAYEYAKKQANSQARLIIKYNELRQALEIRELEVQVHEAKKKFTDALHSKGAIPILREYINSMLRPSYSIDLPDLNPKGLAEVHDAEFEIPTRAKNHLLDTMNRMPGGSLGIAGPRGAGKTTLLRSFCDGSLTEFNDTQVISILAPAPAEYQARDFILHLFSTFAKEVLNKYHVAVDEEIYRQPEKPHSHNHSDHILSLLLPYKWLALGLAFILVSTGVSIGTVKTYDELKPKQTSSSAEAQPQPGEIEKVASNKSNTPDASNTYSALVKGFDLKAMSFIPWGVLLFLMFLLLDRHEKKNSRLSKNAQDRYEDDDYLYIRRKTKGRNVPEKLLVTAIKWLRDIKFQQSFTAGWSGNLNIPIGAGMGINQAQTFAKQQMSLPEIACGLKEFLEEVAKQHQIFIGIDELDKMRTDESARRFLNDIKVIFGVEKCFFLISISENAMSNFERRGLPFRDEFDSSFDDVIYVDYLNFNGASQLIKRRVIGMPVVFVGLCHSLTGGLARDLIRICRLLFSHAGNLEENKSSITHLASTLINQEVQSKLKALEIAVNQIDQSPLSTDLLTIAHRLNSSDRTWNIETLKNVTNHIELFIVRSEKQVALDPNNDTNVSIIVLAREISSFIEYCTYVLHIFANKGLNEEHIEELLNDGVFEHFASARQKLSVDPALAVSLLRQRHQYDTF